MGGSCIVQGPQVGAPSPWGVGWGRGGRETQEGGDICIHIADSHCCTAETNTALQSNQPSNLKIIIKISGSEKKKHALWN